MYAMGIKSFEQTLEKRQISLLKQLLENELTRQLVTKRFKESCTYVTMEKLGLNDETLFGLTEREIAQSAYSKCMLELKVIDAKHEKERETEYQMIINKLFENVNNAKQQLLITMLDSWGCARD
jgi:hypothetical protein